MELQQQQRDRRPDALGDLRVLPDELLCAILDLLEARDVARLACVSSVLYILCNEEPLWMNLCIRDGGLIEYKGSWRKTFLYRQKIYIDPDGSCENLLQFDGFNSLFLYRRWYRRFTTLDTFSFNNGGLDRKTALSLEEFHSEYDGKKPVLIAELANFWPAKNTWTIEQLVKNYGDVAFRISQRTSKKITMKFRDYVSYMELQHDEDPLYVFDDEFGEAAPDLLKDYNVPHLFQEDFFDVLDRDKRPPFRWMIIGPERSGASWHVDPGLTSAWNTLLTGRKRWALYPPGRVPAGVTVHVNEEDGDINIDTPSSLQWWLDVYPLLADEHKPFECTQLPGETIFVPSGWWHCVLNLETTIAVTQNFVNPSNFEYVCLDLTPGHLHKGVCRAGLLAVEDVIGCASAMDQDDYSHMIHKEKRIKTKPEKELHMNTSILNGISKVHSDFENGDFSYDICFLSKFLDEERDHYNSIWSASNCIGQRETRTWLHKLWVTKPQMRQLTWKGACLALNVGKWSSCMLQICASHKLPDPLEDERFPVGTGSNPVYLVSDYVVKIFVEEGLESSLHNLGTELEFYQLLHKAYSSLREYVPPFVASGILVHENGIYKTVPWDGKRMPKMVSDCDVDLKNYSEDCFAFGVWSKMQFTCRKTNVIARTRMWPYLITKKCKGDIFADVRERVSKDDALNLASFLGHQLRDLHLLPVPRLQNDTDPVINNMDLKRRFLDSLGVGSETPALSSTDADIILFSIPVEYELYISVLDKRRRSLVGRLVQWGHPIPKHLIEKVDEYIPHDIALILNTFKDKDGVYKVSGSLNWLHTDIMDDNILMESSSLSTASLENSHLVNGSTSQGQQRKWFPGHILDFSNLSIGDPMNDLIPIYLDVFRGDSTLLSQLLVSYRLPLSRKHCNGLGNDWKNCERLSYHAMCHCILNEENVLGAIFSLSKGLRSAKSWEEVEEAVWGFLNDYQCSD